MKKTNRFQVRLTPRVSEALRRLAERFDISQGATIAKLIEARAKREGAWPVE